MSEWRIGDPVEVSHVELTDGPPGWEECVNAHVVWQPATICGLNPLAVAFADGTRRAIPNATLDYIRSPR